jgi:hypothetical protein
MYAYLQPGCEPAGHHAGRSNSCHPGYAWRFRLAIPMRHFLIGTLPITVIVLSLRVVAGTMPARLVLFSSRPDPEPFCLLRAPS